MKVLIIEDEHYTAERLRELIFQQDPGIRISGILCGVSEAIQWYEENQMPDLIFQDIELKDGNCFEIYEKVHVSAPIVFTTAYSEYAIRSFSLNSIEYLVKPYNSEDIKRVFKKYKGFKEQFAVPESALLEKLLRGTKNVSRQRFLIRSGNNYRILQTGDIAFFFSEDGLTFAVDRTGKKHPVDSTLNQLCLELDPAAFFKISRKHLVGANSIKKIHNWFSGRLKLELDPIPSKDAIVSRNRVKEFKEWIGG